MAIVSQKGRAKRSSVVKEIKVEGKVDEGREIIVRRATAKWKGFEPLMVLWTKGYERI